MLRVEKDSVGTFRAFVTIPSGAIQNATTPVTFTIRDLTSAEVSRHDTVFSAPR